MDVADAVDYKILDRADWGRRGGRGGLGRTRQTGPDGADSWMGGLADWRTGWTTESWTGWTRVDGADGTGADGAEWRTGRTGADGADGTRADGAECQSTWTCVSQSVRPVRWHARPRLPSPPLTSLQARPNTPPSAPSASSAQSAQSAPVRIVRPSSPLLLLVDAVVQGEHLNVKLHEVDWMGYSNALPQSVRHLSRKALKASQSWLLFLFVLRCQLRILIQILQ